MVRRVVVLLAVCTLMALSMPARATTGAVVVAQGSKYLPGDRSLPQRATVIVRQGSEVMFASLDVGTAHDIVEVRAAPRFRSGVYGLGQSGLVAGVEGLSPGTYAFTCSLHPSMFGDLQVIA